MSSRPSYNLTFDASLLGADQDESEALLRLLELCRDQGLTWEDGLPITGPPPSPTAGPLGDAATGRFLTYLEGPGGRGGRPGGLSPGPPGPAGDRGRGRGAENPADDILTDDDLDTDAKRAAALLEELTAGQLSGALLDGAGLSAARLIELMREDLDVPARLLRPGGPAGAGGPVRDPQPQPVPGGPLRAGGGHRPETISLLNDGAYAGAKVTPLLRPGVRDGLCRPYPGVPGQHREPGGEGRPGGRATPGTTPWARPGRRPPLRTTSRAPTASGWCP